MERTAIWLGRNCQIIRTATVDLHSVLCKIHLTMDTPVTKRLIISGLTPSITADDISRRLTSFGTVKAADGFGLLNGVGETRKFGYVTLETTTGKLAKCKIVFFRFQFSG